MQRYEFLKERQLEQIHQATLDILEQTGVEFRSPAALAVLAKNGAKVVGERVFFPRQLVEEQLQKAPSQFTLHARNPKNNVVIGGDSLVFCPGYGAPYVTDLDRGRRKGTMEDYVNFAKLAGASKNLDLVGGILVEPNDVPQELRPTKMLYACMKNADKCFMGSAAGAQNARDSIAMASILFGGQDLAQKPVMISLINSVTPLIYDDRMLGALMEYAKAGQTVIIASLAMAGSTSPVTLAGTMVLQNAEVLAGIVLAQLIREGTPVVYGSASTITEMRTAALSIGAPETAILASASAQLARFYNLPCRGAGAITDAKLPDAQAGYESMMNLLMAQCSGINFVLHAAGILEAYNCMSYEKFVIDDEICGMVKRINKGFAIDQDSLALEIIKRVGPAGHFLDQDHTFTHFRTEFYQAQLSNRLPYDIWQQSGGSQSLQAANRLWKETLQNYEPPALPEDVERELLKYMANIS